MPVRSSEVNIESLPVGTVVDGRYEIKSRLGSGGMCVVYRAHHLGLDCDVALKFLQLKFLLDQKALARFRVEAVAVSALDHPNIVKVFGCGCWNDAFPYMAMEFLEGRSLAQVLEAEQRLSWEQTRPLFMQCLDGLGMAHSKGVIHRDLKPSNIMIVGPEKHVKIVDFGIAKILPESGKELQKLTQTGDLLGTCLYMCPDYITNQVADARSDLYSVGCVLYETLDGRPPFTGSTSVAVMHHHLEGSFPESAFIRDPLRQVIMMTMAKNANDRPASAEELKSLLLDPNSAARRVAEPFRAKRFLTPIGLLVCIALGLAMFSVLTKVEPPAGVSLSHKPDAYVHSDWTNPFGEEANSWSAQEWKAFQRYNEELLKSSELSTSQRGVATINVAFALTRLSPGQPLSLHATQLLDEGARLLKPRISKEVDNHSLVALRYLYDEASQQRKSELAKNYALRLLNFLSNSEGYGDHELQAALDVARQSERLNQTEEAIKYYRIGLKPYGIESPKVIVINARLSLAKCLLRLGGSKNSDSRSEALQVLAALAKLDPLDPNAKAICKKAADLREAMR